MTVNLKTKRKYSHSDEIMLSTIATMVENAILNKAVVVAKRPLWKDPYLPDFITRIDLVVKTTFGVDSAKDLRTATQAVNSIQADALTQLSFFNTEIVQDFKKTPVRKKEILTTLGFNEFYKDAYTVGSHSSFISLLYRFKLNMTPAIRLEITSKGTDDASIDDIIALADSLKSSNVTQETFKVNRPVITESTIKIFNDIYDDTITIGRVCANIFKGDKAIKDTFSYKLIAHLQHPVTPKKRKPKPPVTPLP